MCKVAAVLLVLLCAQGCALAEWMMEQMITFGATALMEPIEDANGGVGPH